MKNEYREVFKYWKDCKSDVGEQGRIRKQKKS